MRGEEEENHGEGADGKLCVGVRRAGRGARGVRGHLFGVGEIPLLRTATADIELQVCLADR